MIFFFLFFFCFVLDKTQFFLYIRTHRDIGKILSRFIMIVSLPTAIMSPKWIPIRLISVKNIPGVNFGLTIAFYWSKCFAAAA